MLGDRGRGALDFARERGLLLALLACAALLTPQSAAAAADPTTHVVRAQATLWDVREVAAVAGDSVEWRWEEGFHDLWLVDSSVPQGEEAGREQQLRDIQTVGAPPVTGTFPAAGSWDFYCKVHNGRGPEAYRMSGTITVAPRPSDEVPPHTTAALVPAAPGPGGVYGAPVTVTLGATDEGGSGVDRTRYRIDGGAVQEYTGPFTISAPGAHTVTFASTDRDGNAEPERQVAFTIVLPAGDPPPPPPAGSGDPPAPPPPPPAPAATAALGALPAKLAAAKLGRGVRVRGACASVATGTLRLTIARRDARRQRLGRTLARATVACRDGSFSVRLRPARKVRKALGRLRGSVRATLALELRGDAGAARDTATLRINGSKAARR